MKIEITEQVKNNLITFLDRVPIKGHKEIAAMNEVMYCLTKCEQSAHTESETKEKTDSKGVK